ncbi:TonB family protein [Nibricoccus sp. IMCC34717]|uniref:TonB family protein n=1 Tax=Nibricoccus sp. IMCC34717 TaxID=3034021 RepID=UPI00384AF622
MKAHTALALLSLASVGYAAEPKVEPMKIEQTQTPRFPSHLSWRGILTGEATIVVSVDEAGKVRDIMPLAYTKKAFADEAIRVARDWNYRPMTVDGQAHPSVTELRFNFESTGVVVERTVYEMVQAYLNNGFDRKVFEFALCPMRNLDRIPTPVKMVTPYYPGKDGKPTHEGSVTVEFYIDQEGKVRFPCLRQAANDELALSALNAVGQWQFEPPMREGEPVVVRATQEFRFVLKKDK